MTHDMTKGNPTSLIIKFTIPLLIGNIFQQFYNLADTFIVGRTLGADALSAVGSTGAVNFLILGFIQGLTGGFTVITAQRFGAGDEKGVKRSIAAVTWLSIISTIIVTAVAVYYTMPLLELMKTIPSIIDDAYAYIVVIFGGMFACVFYNLMSGILRALGDSKTPLIFLVVACILNVILDYVLIVPFKMGVAGAAYATVAAQFISGLACLVFAIKRFPIIRIKKDDFKLDLKFAYSHVRIGLPMAVQFSITALGVMIMQRALNSFGKASVAGYTAAMRIIGIAEQPMISFGVTIGTYVAQNYGAKQYERIKIGIRKCVMLSMSFCFVGCAIMLLFGGQFVSLFISDVTPEIIKQAKVCMFVNSCTFALLGLLFIYRNVLQSIGKNLVPTIGGAIELLLRFAVGWSLGYFTFNPELGFFLVCLAEPLAWLGADIPLYIKYQFEIHKMIKAEREANKTSAEAEALAEA